MMKTRFQSAYNRRRETRQLAGRFRGGRLNPVMAVPFLQNESGVLTQSVHFNLDPIPGQLQSEITAGVVAVYVPNLAVDALKGEGLAPGNAEMFREKLMSGQPVFGLDDQSLISRRCGVVPRSINGEKKVSEVPRLAHNAAVNFLRQRLYVNARQVDADSRVITPALLSQTVLDKFNAVLEPEDRINGAVSLAGQVPVKGIGRNAAGGTTRPNNHNTEFTETGGETELYEDWGKTWTNDDSDKFVIRMNSDGHPQIYADMGDSTAELSLDQFYAAEQMDRITRQMRQMVDDNPEYGEELVVRLAHGLSVETGRTPFVLYEKEVAVNRVVERATDGPNLGVDQTVTGTNLKFSVPVPKTEFGGVVVTFAYIKPDETVDSQPHPILSDVTTGRNYIADRMALDPEPVTVRELDAECEQADESRVCFYTARNELYRDYLHYGFTSNTDLTTVEAKTAIWQLSIPISVSPDSVIYPGTIPHYPFADQDAEVCQYTVSSQALISTPLVYGPIPVEELSALDQGVFEEE